MLSLRRTNDASDIGLCDGGSASAHDIKMHSRAAEVEIICELPTLPLGRRRAMEARFDHVPVNQKSCCSLEH
jgi:hypothetical protein